MEKFLHVWKGRLDVRMGVCVCVFGGGEVGYLGCVVIVELDDKGALISRR